MYKDEGRIEKKKRKRNFITPFVTTELPIVSEGDYHQASDSSKSINSISLLGTEIRRVRTLPVPPNLYLKGMRQEQTTKEIKKVEFDIEHAEKYQLSSTFWLSAISRMEYEFT